MPMYKWQALADEAMTPILNSIPSVLLVAEEMGSALASTVVLLTGACTCIRK